MGSGWGLAVGLRGYYRSDGGVSLHGKGLGSESGLWARRRFGRALER